MEKYIGTKRLEATPMTLGDYNKKRGWTIPENEDPNKEGYFVQYSDDYVSWSPKEVFEESYILENDNTYTKLESHAPHQDRVIEETSELLVKIKALKAFIESNPFFETIDLKEKCRLKLQLVTMQGYYSVLTERIENF